MKRRRRRKLRCFCWGGLLWAHGAVKFGVYGFGLVVAVVLSFFTSVSRRAPGRPETKFAIVYTYDE